MTNESLADGYPITERAFLTYDVTTPMKSAVTAFSSCHLERIVTASTTQRLAIIDVSARLIADPALGAMGVDARVRVTEIRRPFEINQFQGMWTPSPFPAHRF